jgi:hypothetical protein
MPKPKIDGLLESDRPSGVTLRHVVAPAYALPSISGDECARALERCGLVRCDEGAGVVWMEIGASFVCVPRCENLPPETLADILSTSGLSAGDFVKELARGLGPCAGMN